MGGEVLYGIDEWLLALVFVALLYAGAELGFRAGCRAAGRIDEGAHPHVATIEGALLGLLALLLGFAFSMGMTRFDARKQLVVEEANDIGSTYLRADLLPEGAREPTKALLREYVASRLRYYEAGADRARIGAAVAASAELHGRLWSEAMAAVRTGPVDEATALYLDALNGVIDDHARRLRAMENHIPEVVLVLLALVAILTTAVTGYSAGLKRARLTGLRLILIVLLAATWLVIIDLDRPRRGLITVVESSLLELQAQIGAPN